MDKKAFQELLAEEVKSYKALLETPNNDWIVKGFIDVNKNIYGITNDTKVVSKVIEIILIPKLAAFAKRNDLVLEFPSAQNFYPDLTFKDEEGNMMIINAILYLGCFINRVSRMVRAWRYIVLTR